MALSCIHSVSSFWIHCIFWLSFLTNATTTTNVSYTALWSSNTTDNVTNLPKLQTLSLSTRSFLLLQNSKQHQGSNQKLSYPVMITISQSTIWTSLWFQQVNDLFVQNHEDLMFLNYVLKNNTEKDAYEIYTILQDLITGIKHVVGVFLMLSDKSVFDTLTKPVCLFSAFKWTDIIHNTEWVLVTANSSSVSNFSDNSCHACFDFFTHIYPSEEKICIQHTSRGIKHLPIFCKETWSPVDIGNTFEDLMRPKVEGLEGMHLPVGIVNDDKKYLKIVRTGNSTKYAGFALDLLDLLSTALKFEYTLVVVTDDEEYGTVLQDGSATGLTGMLARKEIALSSMGFARTDNRLQAIDYIDTIAVDIPVYLTYKLPEMESQIDLRLIDIVQFDFLISILGPAFALVFIGALVHVSTRSCSVQTPGRPSKQDLRRLVSFPDHACFHSTKPYANQTGRILRASWALFWVVIIAAYSAYLVTSFTVKPIELQLDSLEKLLKHPEYQIASTQLHSALLTYMQTSHDETIQSVWQRIATSNRTDPLITTPDRAIHLQRILDGNYAFVDITNSEDLPLYTGNDTNYRDIRSYYLPIFKSLEGGYVVLPKNVFYKHAIEKAMLVFEESGVLRFLQEKHFLNRRSSNPRTSVVSKQTSVQMPIFGIFVLLAGCGIVVAFICLGMEILYNMSGRKTCLRTV